jgi:NACHT domain
LEPVYEAAFDSNADEDENKCHPGTRVDVLHQIREWTNEPEGKSIFWLKGMAGTGKSTISRTLALELADNELLGASFFFKRTDARRNNAARFFPTIAAQLVKEIPSMSGHVRNSIDAEPSIVFSETSKQFRQLILEPLKKVNRTKSMVVVIDALDECGEENKVTGIISLLTEVAQLPSMWLKFFVTSRPEAHIRESFQDLGHFHNNVALHEVPMNVIEADIRTFLEFKLKEIHGKLSKRLPAAWPSREKFEKLVKMAVPLFIFATTACRFIEDRKLTGSPDDRFEMVLRYETTDHESPDHESKLAATYLPVLDQMIHGFRGSARVKSIKQFNQIVGSIAVLAHPLSANCLAILLGILIADIDSRLELLHSILNIPSNQYLPITIFHLSFRDFLLDTGKCANEFWVDEEQAHQALAENCIQLLSNCFKPESGTGRPKALIDICDTSQSGALVTEVDSKQVKQHLLPEIQYACLYWIPHLQKSNGQLHDNDQVHCFLQKHLLHWLEALGWMGKVTEGVYAITLLESLIVVSKTSSP